MTENLEFKGLVDVIIEKFLDIMSIKPFKPNVDRLLQKEYLNAMDKVETSLKPNINFVPEGDKLEFLNDYVFQNLQKHADEVGDNLRQELQRGILNKETPTQLKERVSNVFKDKKYTDRLKTVMRTEKLRAANTGAYDAAVQAKEVGIALKKYLSIIDDDRTSEICKAELKKYGSKDKAIPLEEEFTVSVRNKTYSAQNPPFHPNCRTVIRFVREE